MKLTRMISICAAIMMVMTLPVLLTDKADAAIDGQQENVSEDYQYTYDFEVWDDKIVAFGSNDHWYRDFTREVALYDLDSSTRSSLSAGFIQGYNPDIHGDRIVFEVYTDQGLRKVFYDHSSGGMAYIGDPSGAQLSYPKIWDDNVVYTYVSTSTVYINLTTLNNNTDRMLASDLALDVDYDLWNNRMVYEDSGSTTGKDIILYYLNNNTKKVIERSEFPDLKPRMHGNYIVYTRMNYTHDFLMYHDLRENSNKTIYETDMYHYFQDYDVWGDRIVYTFYNSTSPANMSLAMYDISTDTTTILKDRVGNDSVPRIFKDKIYWTEFVDDQLDVFSIQIDGDNDGVYDWEDAFPKDPSEIYDHDSDGIGDVKDHDDDNDGHPDLQDAFPFNAAEWLDTDNDGLGNVADLDDDNDGIPDIEDAFPFNPVNSIDFTEIMDRLNLLEIHLNDSIGASRIEILDRIGGMEDFLNFTISNGGEQLSTQIGDVEMSLMNALGEVEGRLSDHLSLSFMKVFDKLEMMNFTIKDLIVQKWDHYDTAEQEKMDELMQRFDDNMNRSEQMEMTILEELGFSEEELMSEMDVRFGDMEMYLSTNFQMLEDLITMSNMTLHTLVQELFEVLGTDMENEFNQMDSLIHILGQDIDENGNLTVGLGQDMNMMRNIITSLISLTDQNLTRVEGILDDITTTLELLSQIETVQSEIMELEGEVKDQGDTTESADSTTRLLLIVLLVMIIVGFIAVVAHAQMTKPKIEEISELES